MTLPLLLRVHAVLAANQVPAALIGAAALAVHGISRATVDQDLLVSDVRVLDPHLWAALTDARIDPRRGDADDPLAGVVRVHQEGERDVDVVVGRHAWQRTLIAESSPVALPGGSIPVVSAAGLVLLKLYAGGAHDLWDVEQLRAVVGDAVDAEVERTLPQLPSSARAAWARVKAAG